MAGSAKFPSLELHRSFKASISFLNVQFFRCSACDSLFPSLMALEHHKEEFEHWSEEDDICTDDSDEGDDTVISEECERLL